MDSDTLWKLEKILLISSAIFVCIVLMVVGEYVSIFTGGLEIETIIFLSFSTIFIFALSVAPFYFFFKLAKMIQANSARPIFGKISLALTSIYTLTVFWIYYTTSVSISNEQSSTAPVVYAVLPVYIAIVGGLGYGILLLVAKKSSK